MDIYVTSKNSGPSWVSDPLSVVYMGTSLDDAKEAVGEFQRYKQDFDAHHFLFPEIYSAIPGNLEREMVVFYSADGWWYSIVKVTFHEKLETVADNPPYSETEKKIMEEKSNG